MESFCLTAEQVLSSSQILSSATTEGPHGLACSPDDKYVASGFWDDSAVAIWELKDLRLSNLLRGHQRCLGPGYVRDLAWSPNGDVIASAADDGTVRIWDVLTGRCTETLESHFTSGIASVAFSYDGIFLAGYSSHEGLRLWLTQSWQQILTPDIPGANPYYSAGSFISFHPSEPLLAVSALEMRDIWIMELRLSDILEPLKIQQQQLLVTAATASSGDSCFISYSSGDSEFAELLYKDLLKVGVRCWFAPKDLPIGAKIRPSLDSAILDHNKLLLVLSERSTTSQWVEQEVETALFRERKESSLVLFPIRIDDTIFGVDVGWAGLIRNTRNIGDFRNWKNREYYSRAFSRLVHDLRQGHQR